MRIIKRKDGNWEDVYVIQTRDCLFRWWLDAGVNTPHGPVCSDSWSTLEEAKKHMKFFRSKVTEEVVFTVPS